MAGWMKLSMGEIYIWMRSGHYWIYHGEVNKRPENHIIQIILKDTTGWLNRISATSINDDATRTEMKRHISDVETSIPDTVIDVTTFMKVDPKKWNEVNVSEMSKLESQVLPRMAQFSPQTEAKGRTRSPESDSGSLEGFGFDE
jgi:hypothetical protein